MANATDNTPGTALTAPVQTGTPGAVLTQDNTGAAAIIRRNVAILRPLADAVVLVQAQNEARQLIQRLLVDGRDYGKVPGVSKPSLLKPGAEKFNAAYGLVARFTIVEKEVDHDKEIRWVKRVNKWTGRSGQRRQEVVETSGTSYGLYRYVINCELIDRATGEVVGSSLGSCSTLESKYVDRPRDLENTVIKMSEKRAYIGATLLTHGLSEQFTQDVEDTGVASDDTQAVQPIEPDPGANVEPPAEGTAEWAMAFEIATGIRAALKLPDTVQTFGQLDWKQLEKVVEGMDRVKSQNPTKAANCDLVIRAAKRMQEELEERAALAADSGDGAAGAPAHPTSAGASNAPTAPAPAAGENATNATKSATTGNEPLNPLHPTGGAVPSMRADQEAHAGLRSADRARGTSAQDEPDDLPF